MPAHRAAMPSKTHSPCRLRKCSGSWKRSAAMMALAEYTITTPMETRATMSAKSQRSGVSFLGTGQLVDDGHEDLAAVLVVVEHVEGGTGRREQHHVARARQGAGGGHRVPHGGGVDAGHARRLESRPYGGAIDPDEHRLAHVPPRGIRERREVLPLPFASRDQHDRLREALERLYGRGDVGALGVVVVDDAAFLGDALDAVGDAAERADARADRLGRQSHPEGAGGGGQHVLHVVLAAQGDLTERADRLDVAVEPGHDPAVLDEDPMIESPKAAEPNQPRSR